MKDNDDRAAKQSNYGLTVPTSWSAEEALFLFLNEIKHPISSLEGYINIISEVGTDPNYINGLLSNIEQLRNLFDSMRVYLMETNYLSQEKEVMHFLRENVFDPIMDSPKASSMLKALIVKTVKELNAEARWQIVNSWLYMTSKPAEFEVMHKMKEEGFLQFETTLAEFRTRFAHN